jgi:poly(3-hydroxyalkanoate) synthetase
VPSNRAQPPWAVLAPPSEAGDAEAPGGWKASLFSGRGDDRPVVGAVRTTQRSHWTKEAARAEAQQWLAEMKTEPITTWDTIDDKWEIGRNQTHYVIVRRILVPLGARPIDP